MYYTLAPSRNSHCLYICHERRNSAWLHDNLTFMGTKQLKNKKQQKTHKRTRKHPPPKKQTKQASKPKNITYRPSKTFLTSIKINWIDLKILYKNVYDAMKKPQHFASLSLSRSRAPDLSIYLSIYLSFRSIHVCMFLSSLFTLVSFFPRYPCFFLSFFLSFCFIRLFFEVLPLFFFITTYFTCIFL